MHKRRFHFSTAKTLIHIVVYFLLFLAGDLLSSVLFDWFFSLVSLPAREWYFILRMAGCLVLTYGLFWLYTTRALHLRMRDFGITLAIKKWGVLLAVFLPVFVLVVFGLIGQASVHMFSIGEMLLVVVASLMTALKAGILEEVLFRGYIMRLLEDRWNKYVAILLPSFLFSLVHLPSLAIFSVTNVLLLVTSGTLVGVMFSLAAYKGNSISNSALLHGVWNFVMITDILHITTAQGAYDMPIISIIIPAEPVWLTGGGFGIESSVVAMLGYALVCGCLLWGRRR